MKACALLFPALLVCSGPALAAPKVDVHGLVLGEESARFLKGVPTLDFQKRRGAVQVRPLGFDHGSLMFGVAVYNDSMDAVNIGIEDIHATIDGQPVKIFTVQELIRKEKNRAVWSQIGIAFLGALGSAAAASQRNTYYSTMSTPYGSYSIHGSYPSLAGQLQAADIRNSTALGMMGIQLRLDQTLEKHRNQIVQRTTVDPGDSYAGSIILAKFDYSKVHELRLTLNWNGESYPFGFVITKSGKPIPDQYADMLAIHAKPKVLAARMPPGPANKATTPLYAAKAPIEGAIVLRSGAIKVPAKTASGYCLRAPEDYRGSGSKDYPAITRGLPRCEDEGHDLKR